MPASCRATPTRDRYGRLLAYVLSDDLNTSVEMVRLGYSLFYTEYGEGRYAEAFRVAEGLALAQVEWRGGLRRCDGEGVSGPWRRSFPSAF